MINPVKSVKKAKKQCDSAARSITCICKGEKGNFASESFLCKELPSPDPHPPPAAPAASPCRSFSISYPRMQVSWSPSFQSKIFFKRCFSFCVWQRYDYCYRTDYSKPRHN